MKMKCLPFLVALSTACLCTVPVRGNDVKASLAQVSNGHGDSSTLDTFLNGLVIDHISACANVALTDQTCLDLTLRDMLLRGDSSGTVHEPIRRNLQRTLYNGNVSHEDFAAYTNGEAEMPTCEMPHFDAASIEVIVEMSKGKCLDDGKDVEESTIDTATERLTALFGASQCWESLCHDETMMMLITDYMEDCADVDLPFLSGGSPDDDIVGCMIDFVMSTPNSEFSLPLPEPSYQQLEDSHDHCYPPGHYDVQNLCPSTIAPTALRHCTGMGRPDIPPPGNHYGSMSYQYGDDDYWGWDEDLFFDDQLFSSMSMSMSMSIDYSSGDDDKPPKDLDRDARLMEDFCVILDQLSSEKGKQCLLPLCGIEGEDNDNNESTPPSSMPSTEPSVMPSAEPSEFPSSAPSPLPTSSVSNGIIEIRYEASINVDNLDISAIPVTPGEELNKIVNVLKEVLSQFLPANSVARILSIGGIPVASPTDRRLR